MTEPPGSTRVLLVTGKGGGGKTTTAASMAVAAASSGHRVLVLSTDPAHSLGDVLDVDLPSARHWRSGTDVPVGVPGSPGGLTVLAVDHHTDVEADWDVVRDHLLRILEGLDVDPVIADELVTLPGADEVHALLTLALAVDSGDWDLVVVDCAPSAETLRLLTLPEILGWHLDRLLPAQRRLLTTLRPAAAAATGIPLPDREVLDVIGTWRRLMARCREVLTGPSASVRIVLTRREHAVHDDLVHGIPVEGEGGPQPARLRDDDTLRGEDEWRSAWNRAQADGLTLIIESFDGIPVTVTPHVAGEPIGVAALAALADERSVLAGTPRALTDPVEVAAPRVTGAEDGFVLEQPIGLADAAAVRVQRRADDLIVSVGGDRRIIALPSALRRCVVENASVGSGMLTVRFVKDEEVWPHGR